MSAGQREGITARAFLIGTWTSLLIGVGIGYAQTSIRGSPLAIDFSSPVAFFLLFLIAALLNPLLGWLRRTWYLTAAETTLVYIMALISASISSMGLTDFFLPYLSGAHYYASPENGWGALFLQYVPDWLAVRDPEAIKNLYEGNPQGVADVPWAAWLPALLAWLPFFYRLVTLAR